jgi:hypothetical protein
MEKQQIVMVVYDPPSREFPFLSAVFVPGRSDPVVTACATAADAEAYNEFIAAKFAEKGAGP